MSSFSQIMSHTSTLLIDIKLTTEKPPGISGFHESWVSSETNLFTGPFLNLLFTLL